LGSSIVSGRAPVLVITGTSGAGKGTLVKALLARVPALEAAVSATTRSRRPGEENGRHYWFLSAEEFDRRLGEEAFLEFHVFPWGQRSGTLLSEIDRISARGRIPLLELETYGALNVRDRVPGSVTIFIAADVPELERRLRERATESTGEIGGRIALARNQLEQAHLFRYMVRNDDVERATSAVGAIVECELAFAGTMSRP